MKAATIRQGTTAPTDSVGVNGDFYLRIDTGELYQRQSGVYVTVAIGGGGDGVGGKLYLFNNY